MSGVRYRLDGSVQRFGRVIVGGSPLKLFRVTDAGAAVVDRIAAGEAVPPSTLVGALAEAGAVHPVPSGGPFTAADVTIVVPCRHLPGAPAPRLPVGALVVDDGSPDPLPDAALRLPENRGPAAARNAGVAMVTTALVAFVDADVGLPAGWLDPLLPHFHDARVGLVAPRVLTPAGRGGIARYERDHSPLDLGPEPARVRCGTRVSYVPAAAIVCRVEALRDIDGFDEGLRFGEDVDLVWRLDEAGWRCRYEPASEVLHDPRRDVARLAAPAGGLRHVRGAARAPPPGCVGADPHERVERRRVVAGRHGPAGQRRGRRCRFGRGADPPTARRAATGCVPSRRDGEPARRRPDLQRDPAGVVARPRAGGDAVANGAAGIARGGAGRAAPAPAR